MNAILKIALAVAGVVFATQAAARITFYENESFGGRTFTTERQVGNFERFGFNDRASSVDVVGNRWEVCEDARFSGRCVILRPGRYPSLASLGLNNRVSSARLLGANVRIDDSRYAPPPVVARDGRDYRRRNSERLYEANVTSVRAVVGTPQQRCWIEREQVPQSQSGSNDPRAIAGALISGILGHQQQAQSRDVQRCASVPSQSRPDYWDVTYTFRGQEHRVQMSAPPGPTVTVNERGEPRA
ncbi:MAG: beta/gamma crystallin-related protein [Pseudomonadota bacterium]